MSAIIGKVVAQSHMNNREAQALIAKNYRRDPNDTESPFGKEVTLMVIKNYIGWVERAGQKFWGQKSGGTGYSGIILGPKFNSDGSVDISIIGIGTTNEILDFQIDPNAPEKDGHATLLFDSENSNDFTEITGRWNEK